MRVMVGAVISMPPFSPGMAWNWLHHVLGLADLGHEVHFIEEVRPEWCVDETGRPSDYEHSLNRKLFRATLGRFGLLGRACQLFDGGRATEGSLEQLVRTAKTTDLLINMSGHVTSELVLGSVGRRAYVDQDPVYTQLWRSEYGKDLNLSAHDVFFTVGMNIGTPHSPIPDGGIRWHPTLPPVVLDYWPAPGPGGPDRFTTVASWSTYGDLSYRGQWYRSKYEEFRRFAALPRLTGRVFEVGLKSHRSDDEGVRLLRDQGWIVTDTSRLRDLEGYQAYIAGSRAEIGIAKNAYVKGTSGWFGDRSAHYLASGRPVLHQATGFERWLPTGRGLLSFGTVEEATAAVEEIDRDYAGHCRAARELAAEHLSHRKVLSRMMEIAMSDERQEIRSG